MSRYLNTALSKISLRALTVVSQPQSDLSFLEFRNCRTFTKRKEIEHGLVVCGGTSRLAVTWFSSKVTWFHFQDNQKKILTRFFQTQSPVMGTP